MKKPEGIKKSLEYLRRAEKVIPGASQTSSKAPSQFVGGVAPVFLEEGKGSHVWDVDGNEYIDYVMALGPIILGHNYSAVTEAVKKALEKSTTFTLPHRIEVELAELLNEVIPCAEMARFGKNGSDATSGAVRLARAYTGRDKIACCGYHGWQDWYIGVTERNMGIPESVSKLTLTFEYNKIESLEKIFAENKDEIACVIMEPAGLEEPRDDFLQKVKGLTRKNGSLLVFDEIVTGFRLAMGGAQEYFGVIPDLACFGKAMANGFPISAVAGKREFMKLFKEVCFSFTFGGEIASIAASMATIRELRGKNVIPYLWKKGKIIKDGYNAIAQDLGLSDRTECAGFAPRTVLRFRDENGEDDLLLKSLFQQECVERNILFAGGHNICLSHTDNDIRYTLDAYREALEILKEAVRKKDIKGALRGKPLQPVFRRA